MMVTEETELSAGEFRQLSGLIYRYSGICLAPGKRLMLSNRLRQRVKSGEFASLRGYLARLFKNPSEEAIAELVELATTHHTAFFREESHFEFLRTVALPSLRASSADRIKPVRVWSTAASSGEEPYTLAMVLADWVASQGLGTWRILASDISRPILMEAERGIYPDRKVQSVSDYFRSKYFERGTVASGAAYRVNASLRASVEFRRINLLDDDYRLTELQDIIFCRNVMIYFDLPTRAAVVERLVRCLSPRGYLVIGHTENLTGISSALVRVGPGVFQRADAHPQGSVGS
jgi:chemotaxis protein methyltransferase CheR